MRRSEPLGWEESSCQDQKRRSSVWVPSTAASGGGQPSHGDLVQEAGGEECPILFPLPLDLPSDTRTPKYIPQKPGHRKQLLPCVETSFPQPSVERVEEGLKGLVAHLQPLTSACHTIESARVWWGTP